MDSRVALREAAQQALEALELIDKEFKKHGRQHWPEAAKARNTAPTLRAALAEPNHDYERGFVEGMSEQARRSVDHAVNAMAQRKPLTDEEIGAAANSVRWSEQYHIKFARAIERAHGIGDK